MERIIIKRYRQVWGDIIVYFNTEDVEYRCLGDVYKNFKDVLGIQKRSSELDDGGFGNTVKYWTDIVTRIEGAGGTIV